MKLMLCALALAVAKEHTNYQAIPEHPKLREKSLVVPLTKVAETPYKAPREKPAQSFLDSAVTRKDYSLFTPQGSPTGSTADNRKNCSSPAPSHRLTASTIRTYTWAIRAYRSR